MSAAVYLTGIESIDEMETSEALDNFVSKVLATSNVMWAAANFEGINMSEDLGRVANDLYYDAVYLRKRLDRQLEERMEQIEKDRPELFEEEEEQLSGVIPIESVAGSSNDIDDMLSQIRAVADLIQAASRDVLLDDTVENAGLLIERLAGGAIGLLEGDAS